VVVLGRREAELHEDVRDVLLDRALGDHELAGDGQVGATLGHQPEHVALAWDELVERGVVALAQQLGDGLGVQGGAALGLERRAHALLFEAGRQADIDDADVGAMLVDRVREGVAVGRGRIDGARARLRCSGASRSMGTTPLWAKANRPQGGGACGRSPRVMSEVISIHAARSATTADRSTTAASRSADGNGFSASGNAREDFRIVQRGGRTFHVYGSDKDHKVFELPHGKKPAGSESPTGRTPAA
jgi:hypothetical protein